MTRILVTLGIILIVVGLAWPWLTKLGLGRLPGDIVFERENFRFYFPITTMVLISLVLSLIFWLFRK
jgi:ribose/xylose/arabinose/galactoside ABC-type transport system permease subunit